MATQITLRAIEELLACALCYRWAARLFFYPEENLLTALTNGQAQRELREAAAHLRDPEPVKEALDALWSAWEASQKGELPLAAEHTYFFARHVLAPPYESRYRESGGNSLAQDLSEVAGFYAAFGFQVGERAKELPDHLSIELEFLAALYLKEAYALEQGWPARAKIAGKARDKFLREHLLWWFSHFQEKLQEHARLPFYPAAGAFVHALLAQEQNAAAEAPTEAGPNPS